METMLPQFGRSLRGSFPDEEGCGAHSKRATRAGRHPSSTSWMLALAGIEELRRSTLSMLASATRHSIHGDLRGKRDSRFGFVSHSTPRTGSRLDHKSRNAGEIVGSGRHHERLFDQRTFAMACLAQRANRLDPAEEFFASLALARADKAAVGSVDRRAPVCIAVRDMRCNANFAAARHELCGIVVLVAALRAPGPSTVFENIERGLALRRAVRPALLYAKTVSQYRLSLIRCPMWQSLRFFPAATGVRLQPCIRRCRAEHRSIGDDPFGAKLFLAYASIKVRSIEKCLLVSNRLTCGR